MSVYERAREFVLRHWHFGIHTEVGDFKGRECPGHSILPNVLLYEATKDKRFLDTAITQATWVVKTLDPADPKVTKGQRMSEHLLLTGLTALFPHADHLLSAWRARWADVMIARSENAYDFRKYDNANWTLPRFTAGSHGGATAFMRACAPHSCMLRYTKMSR